MISAAGGDALRDAIGGAVAAAPEPDSWSDIERRASSSRREARHSRRPLLLAAAAVLAVGVGGAAYVLTRPISQTIRTDDPIVTEPTSTSAVSTTTIKDDALEVGDTPSAVALPVLPNSVNELWSTTIEGSYPQAAVRIGDTIIFGQGDLSGVRAVDAVSGEVLWSVVLEDDPNAVITSLTVIDGFAVASWRDSNVDAFVTGFDATGEAWSSSLALVVSGVVVRTNPDTLRLEVLAGDGSVRGEFDLTSQVGSMDDQLVIEEDGGVSWYEYPSLERVVGPVQLDGEPPFASVALPNSVVAFDEAGLHAFDTAGELRSEVEIERVASLRPVGGERPGVLAVVSPTTPLDDSGELSRLGTTTFFESIDGVLTEVWTRTGRLEHVVEVDGREFVVHSEYVDGDLQQRTQSILDAATGAVVASNDLYDDGGAANGFVFAQLDNGPEDLQSVFYDQTGREIWRLALVGRERAEIVDGGVLVARVDTIATTVELTFYTEG